MPFERPDRLPAWTAADAAVLASSLAAALREKGTVTVVATPADTEVPLDRPAIAKAAAGLKVDYVLEGGVTEYGVDGDGSPGLFPTSLQITFQLFDGKTGAMLWVDEGNASSLAQPRAANVRSLSETVARAVAERVARTEF